MDEIDRASQMEEMIRQAEIAAVVMRPRKAALESSEFCESEVCGEPIPEARRLAVPGCRFCVECQSLRERALQRRTHASGL